MEAMPARIHARSQQQAMEWSLVLVSQGIESTIDYSEEAGGWGLLVGRQDSERALRSLRLYKIENRRWPLRREVFRTGVLFDWSSLAWVLLMVVFYGLAQDGPLRSAGLMDNLKASAGEWWRIFTAVWLHGDIGHLASNCTSGFVFLGLAMGRYGTGIALVSAYLAGAVGNIAGWVFALETHRSLGASGMVMGALGLLATQSVALLPKASAGLRLALAGVLAGLMLFVLMGLSPDTDVLAHLGGFAGGILLGVGLARFPRIVEDTRAQAVGGLLFVLLAILPWWLAISGLRQADG